MRAQVSTEFYMTLFEEYKHVKFGVPSKQNVAEFPTSSCVKIKGNIAIRQLSSIKEKHCLPTADQSANTERTAYASIQGRSAE